MDLFLAVQNLLLPLLTELQFNATWHNLLTEALVCALVLSLVVVLARLITWGTSKLNREKITAWVNTLIYPGLALLLIMTTESNVTLYEHPALLHKILSVGFAIWFALRLSSKLELANKQYWAVIAMVAALSLLRAGDVLTPLTQILDQARLPLGEHSLSLLTIVRALLIFSALIWISLKVGEWLEKTMHNQRMNPSLRTLLVKIFKVIALASAAFLTLNLLGIDLSSLAIFSGALGIGIGFGLKEITSNFISGLLLLMDRSIKPGDVISIDNESYGQVKEMNARYLVMRRRNGTEMLIPNQQLMTNQVVNWSFSNRAVRHDARISVSYNTKDMHKVKTVLTEAVKSVPRVLTVPQPSVFIWEFGASGVEFVVRYWSNDPENGVSNLRGEVNMALWQALKAEKIEIPFPQMVLHHAEGKEAKKKK